MIIDMLNTIYFCYHVVSRMDKKLGMISYQRNQFWNPFKEETKEQQKSHGLIKLPFTRAICGFEEMKVLTHL